MSDTDASRFAVGGFAVAAVLVWVGAAAGLAFVPFAGTYLGMFVGGFVAGLVRADRPLLEAGVAAVLAGFGVLLAGTLPGNGLVAAVLAVATVPPTTLLVSVALSFAVGAFGANFGDDLRDGLTAPVEEGDPNPSVFDAAGSRVTATESSDVERGGDESTERRAADAEVSRESESPEGGRRSEDAESADVEFERET